MTRNIKNNFWDTCRITTNWNFQRTNLKSCLSALPLWQRRNSGIGWVTRKSLKTHLGGFHWWLSFMWSRGLCAWVLLCWCSSVLGLLSRRSYRGGILMLSRVSLILIGSLRLIQSLEGLRDMDKRYRRSFWTCDRCNLILERYLIEKLFCHC